MRMSKRAGNVVTIDDLVSVVGVDAARYSLARSDYNQNFDIDLALLASHTNDNPVYYVQYAHARSKNVDRNAAAAGISYEGADLALLDTEADGEVLAALAQFPSVLATAADDRQPHKVARYLEELAATYHKWYNVERVVPMALTDPETRGDDEARKALEIAKNPDDSLDLGLIRDDSIVDYDDLPDPVESGEEAIANLEEAVDLLKSVVRELRALAEEK